MNCTNLCNRQNRIIKISAQQAVTAVAPLSLTETKEWLIVSHSEDDALLQRLLNAVIKQCEIRTRQFFSEHNVTIIASIHNPIFFLPRLPLISLTSIEKRDTNSETYSALDASLYVLNTSTDQIQFYDHGTFRIVCKVGYTSSNEIPEDLQQAILSQMAFLYENRGDKDIDKGLCATAVQMLTPYINMNYYL